MSITNRVGCARFAFVRHAMSVDNEAWLQGLPWPGIADAPLCGKGREALSGIAKGFLTWPVETIISSPLSRCVETARAISETSGAPIEIHYDLAEIPHNAGDLPLCSDLLERAHPDLLIRRPLTDIKARGSMAARAFRVVSQFADRPERRVCLVGHRGWLMALANLDIDNGEVVCLQAEFDVLDGEDACSMRVKQIPRMW